MRIAFWASPLLVMAACTGAENRNPATPAAPITVTATTENATTRFDVQTGTGIRSALTAPRDATVSPDAQPRLEVLGEVSETAIVLVDTYPSIPGGLSFCQAGEERFLRVIAVTGGQAQETLRVKVASCRDNLELASPAIEWLPQSSTVRIHWLLGPNAGMPEVRTIQIGRDGQPRPATG